jgi:hypothetical protein
MTHPSASPLWMVRDVSKSFGAVAADAPADNADVIVGVGTATPTLRRRATPSSATRTCASSTSTCSPSTRRRTLPRSSSSTPAEGLKALTVPLEGYRVEEPYSQRVAGLVADWAKVTDEWHAGAGPHHEGPEEASRTMATTQEVTSAETEAAVTIAVKHWINGAETEGSTGWAQPIYNPATGEMSAHARPRGRHHCGRGCPIRDRGAEDLGRDVGTRRSL